MSVLPQGSLRVRHRFTEPVPLSTPLKSLLAVASLVTVPAAVARIHPSVPALQEKLSTAQAPVSAEGASISRTEMKEALDAFWRDDGMVDPDEHAVVDGMLVDPAFLSGVSGPAREYLLAFEELNDSGEASPLLLHRVTRSGAELFGAAGPLARTARMAEGLVPEGQGTINHDTLLAAYSQTLVDSDATEEPFWFEPITQRQLVELLQGSSPQQPPTPDEVDGAMAYLNQVAFGSARLYAGHWRARLHGEELTGYVIAAVSPDRRMVRMVRVPSGAH